MINYERPTSIGTTVHLGNEPDSPVSCEVDRQEHQYSNGPYAVVKLTLDSLQLTIFPGTRAAELGAVLQEAADQLNAVVVSLRD